MSEYALIRLTWFLVAMALCVTFPDWLVMWLPAPLNWMAALYCGAVIGRMTAVIGGHEAGTINANELTWRETLNPFGRIPWRE